MWRNQRGAYLLREARKGPPARRGCGGGGEAHADAHGVGSGAHLRVFDRLVLSVPQQRLYHLRFANGEIVEKKAGNGNIKPVQSGAVTIENTGR